VVFQTSSGKQNRGTAKQIMTEFIKKEAGNVPCYPYKTHSQPHMATNEALQQEPKEVET